MISYKNLDTFLNDYKQNNFITNIEYFVHVIPEINITFNIYHTEISILYGTVCIFSIIIKNKHFYHNRNVCFYALIKWMEGYYETIDKDCLSVLYVSTSITVK